MLIQIDKLKRQPRRIVVDEQATAFPSLSDLVEHEAVVFNSSINGNLQAIRAGDIIEVTGRLNTSVTSPCSRCLAPVSNQLDVPVTLSYISDEVDNEVPLVEEVELQSEELGLIPFSAAEIDLRPDLGQEIVMALPQQVLCKTTCQGLCPVCGNNLNRGCCNCEPPIFHAGLAALKDIKINQ